MAITTTDDQMIIQVVESTTTAIPGEEDLTHTLKNQTARMLETCFDGRQHDVLETAAKTFAESAVHLHKLLCLQEGVHHSQLAGEELSTERLDAIEEKRDQINDTVEQHIERQVRRYITFAG
jgi:hypothetical protein